RLISEMHSYGLIDISITSHFTAAVKIAETFIVNKRLVSRKRYEQAREAYKDMPPADPTVEDFSGELLKAMRAERRQRAEAAKNHVPDRKAASRTNAFCRSLLKKGKMANAQLWIRSKQHTIGELSHSKSRKIIDRLMDLGAKRVHACDIDDYGN